MPDSSVFQSQGYLEKAKDMAKATAKVPTTGKEDLSGWEKKVYIAAPSISFIKIRFAPRRVDASGRRSLVVHLGAGHRSPLCERCVIRRRRPSCSSSPPY